MTQIRIIGIFVLGFLGFEIAPANAFGSEVYDAQLKLANAYYRYFKRLENPKDSTREMREKLRQEILTPAKQDLSRIIEEENRQKNSLTRGINSDSNPTLSSTSSEAVDGPGIDGSQVPKEIEFKGTSKQESKSKSNRGSNRFLK